MATKKAAKKRHASPKTAAKKASSQKAAKQEDSPPVAKVKSRAAPKKSSVAKKATAARKPALLAGGNPQIAKGDGDAPVRAYIAAAPGWKGETAARLDEFISRTVPKVKKAIKWNSPFYGLEGQGWFLSFHCFAKYIKVAFFRGTRLTPPPPEPSSNDEVRYLHIKEGERFDEKLFTAWLKQAAKLPGWTP
jgi:hypothetical protein